MNVILSVGGSVLAPDLAADRLAAYAEALSGLVDEGHELGVVVGGGPTAREYIETARALDANEIELDDIGIAVTRLNARLLIAAMDDRAAPAPAETYQEGRAALRRGDVPVLGGTVAGQTTDAVSAAFAEYVEADLLVYATSVDGVFDADPNSDADATAFEHLTPAELVDVVVDLEMNAGSSAPVDLLAAKILQRSGMRAIVCDGTDPESVARAVRTGEHGGTDVAAADAPTPAAWED